MDTVDSVVTVLMYVSFVATIVCGFVGQWTLTRLERKYQDDLPPGSDIWKPQHNVFTLLMFPSHLSPRLQELRRAYLSQLQLMLILVFVSVVLLIAQQLIRNGHLLAPYVHF